MKKRFLLSIAAMLLMMPQVLKADGFPRYYELVTETSQLESGKYYLVVAIPDLNNLPYRMAYNGLDESYSKGKARKVVPNALSELFSGVIDREKTGNNAIPLKMSVASETNGNKKWNLIDESTDENHRLIGVYASTSVDDQHHLIGAENNATNAALDRFLWYITINTIGGKVGVAEIRNTNKTYYLKYDANSYDDEATGMFRVYTGEKYNVMLYKGMEVVEATTSFTGHGTLYYSNKVLWVPEGVTAKTYILGENKDKVISNVAYGPDSFIPANSAVILHGNPSTTYTFLVTNRHNPDRDGDNILLGLDNEGTTTTGDETKDKKSYFYMLTTKDGANVGFYWAVSGGGTFTSAAHKAYLAVEKDDVANIRSFLLDSSETTSISNISLPTQEETKWVYDLSGRRVSTSQQLPKGIYIINGKKIAIK